MNLLKRKSIISMVCLFAVFSLTACSSSDVYNNALSFVNEKADAYRAACDTLRGKLRAPSEAVFPTYKSSFVTESSPDNTSYDAMYNIDAYVDAENALGGTVRQNWGAHVYYKKDEKEFYVVIDSFDSDSSESDYDTEGSGGDTGSSSGSDSSSSSDSDSTYDNSNYGSSSNNTYSNNYDDYYDNDEEDEEDEEDSYEGYDDYEDYEDDYEESTSEYVLPDSDSRKLKKSDLSGLSKEELRIARNEIYARHGRKFQDEELQEYFDEQDWYYGTIEPEDFVDSQMLSKLELRNAKYIKKFE